MTNCFYVARNHRLVTTVHMKIENEGVDQWKIVLIEHCPRRGCQHHNHHHCLQDCTLARLVVTGGKRKGKYKLKPDFGSLRSVNSCFVAQTLQARWNFQSIHKCSAVLHYMSSWDWVGMYFKMVGMDPNCCAALCLHLPTTTISHVDFTLKKCKITHWV